MNRSVLSAVGLYKTAFAVVDGDETIHHPLPDISGNGLSCAVSPDGSILIVGVDSSPYMHVIRTDTWSELPGFSSPITAKVRGLSFSHDGGRLAVAVDGGSHALYVLDTGDWSIEQSLVPGVDGYTVAYMPDSTAIAVGLETNPYLMVINTSDWSNVAGVPPGPGYNLSCDISPDGNYLAVGGGSSPYYKVLNTSDWSEISGLPNIPNRAWAVKFSADGGKLFVGHDSGSFLTVISTDDWSIESQPQMSSRVQSISISPSGDRIACGEYSSPYIEYVDASDYSIIQDASDSDERVNAVAYSPEISVSSVDVAILTDAGGAGEAPVRVYDKNTFEFLYSKNIFDNGTIFNLSPGAYWVVCIDQRESGIDMFKQVYFSQSENDPVVFRMSYSGELVTISSNLTTQSGAAGDEVVIRDWNTRELVARVVPDANGDWSAEVPPGTYDVSYLAEGCAPVLHGPYTVELPTP